MFSRKISANSKTMSAEVDFANKNNPDAIVWKSSKNTKVVDGALCSVPDIKSSDAIYYVTGTIEFAQGIMFAGRDGLFLKKLNGSYWNVASHQFTRPCFLYCPKQDVLLISEEGFLTYCFSMKNRTTLPEEWTFSSLALCKERAFGVMQNEIYFSERDDVLQWKSKLPIPDQVVAITEYGDDLVAVGKDIHKISFSDYMQDTRVTCLYKDVGKVFPQTLCVVDNKLFFLSDRGLFCFSQNKLTRLCEDISFATDNSTAVATRMDGYWLAFNDGDDQRQVLYLDNNGEYSIYDIAATHLSGNGGRLIIAAGYPKLFYDKPAKLFWQSKEYDFGNMFQRKHLRKLRVVTKNSLDVHLVTERERRIYHVSGGSHTILLKGVFGKVSVEIHSTEDTRVEKLVLEVQSYGREVTHGYNN